MIKIISVIKKIMIYGSIVLVLIICWGIVCAIVDSNKKYEISGGWDGGGPQNWGWLGLEISGRATNIEWITGYNFSGNFIYGKTPISWFITDTQNYQEIEFRRESSFLKYLHNNNIEFKKLIDVPIFRIPDLFYGYQLAEGNDNWYKRTVLSVTKSDPNDVVESGITKIGLMDDYVVGENDKGWFYVYMPNDKKQFAKNTDELAVILGVSKNELLQKAVDIPDYTKYKLPFKNYTISADIRTANARGLYKINDPCETCTTSSYTSIVRFLEYYKKKKGYIYGKSMTDFFVYNIKNANCAYFGQKKDDWIKELDRLNLPQSGFTKVMSEDRLRKLRQDPWSEQLKYKEYAD